jgi:hypothetical protein
VIDPFVPLPQHFRHQSRLHGQSHVARVMVHALRLIEATGWEHEAARLWAAVYLHDLERTHDGACQRHGADAVKRWQEQLPLRLHIMSGGVQESDYDAIALAVELHCQPNSEEPPHDDPNWPLVALLKDADGLDRVRLGDLDTSMLRLPESLTMVEFAQELYDETHGFIPEGEHHFADVTIAANEILSGPEPPLYSK